MIINFNKKFLNLRYISKITRAYEYVLNYLKIPCKELEVNISFVTIEEIKDLNCKFRNKDASTDVLSFPNLLEIGKTDMQLIIDKLDKKNYLADVNPENDHVFLGDICICKKVAFSHSKEYGTTRLREIVYMAVHGLLHLLGYDHIVDEDKKIMRTVEEKIMKHIKLERK